MPANVSMSQAHADAASASSRLSASYGPTCSTPSDRFTTLPDEETLATTVVALEEHGFSVEVADDLDAARDAVLARIPEGSSVMTNTSVTLDETGIAKAINMRAAQTGLPRHRG